MSYFFRLQAMQRLLQRHRHYEKGLTVGLVITFGGVVHTLLAGYLGPFIVGVVLMTTLYLLKRILPPRIKEHYQRTIAAQLHDNPPPSDSRAPSLKKVSRLLQSPEDFDHTMSEWLSEERSRCLQDKALSRLLG